jgi:hypothetical protein
MKKMNMATGAGGGKQKPPEKKYMPTPTKKKK